jgi:toxin YoeB
MAKAVVWSKRAVREKELIYKYWRKRNFSDSYAEQVENKLNLLIQLLLQSPEIGRRANYKNIRILTLRHFQIYYRIIEDEIQILSFWDSRQNPDKLKFD